MVLCERSKRFSDFKFDISDLIGRAKSISKQLNGWLESLKNTDVRGTKFLTNKDRERVSRDKEFSAFDQQMEGFRRKHLEWLDRRAVDPNIKFEDIE